MAVGTTPDVLLLPREALFEEDGTRSWTIRGAEAAIWDLLALGYRFDRIVHFLSILLNVPNEEARATLLATLQTWERAGMVQLAGGNGHG